MSINEPKRGAIFVLPFYNTNRKKAKDGQISSSRSSLRSNRIPYLNWVPDNVRNHFVATSAEFAGTTLFLFFAFSGTQVALLSSSGNAPNVVGTTSDPNQLLFIALSFGFSLAVNAWVFFRISGGLFNPAVTLGMCLVGALPYIRSICLTVAQILGGITAAAICSALFLGPLTVRTNLGGGTSVIQGLFIEMFLTAGLRHFHARSREAQRNFYSPSRDWPFLSSSPNSQVHIL
ncbi:hypothetical protein EG329_005573 [Mollisiaceae sp. DMI_Dod_QoI]|nr:hypothetical protein EG329_005573 [Helotiales sp. DMI_Dod_QoI]